MINFLRLVVVVLGSLQAASVCAADAGIYAIVDGDARVLRGTAWYRLVAGARAQHDDVIDVAEHTQLQLEFAAPGGAVNLQGPALVHALVAQADKPRELVVQRGWLKAAAAGQRTLRVRTPAVTMEIIDAIIVVRAEARASEVFVESGVVRLAAPSAHGREPLLREAKSGEFISRASDQAYVVAARPPPAFLSAVPRQFRDSLATLAGHFPQPPAALARIEEITLAQAEPWLAGTSRRSFIKRFQPRLGDATFRAGVAARPAAFPEWDRILNPEKYRPRPAAEAR